MSARMLVCRTLPVAVVMVGLLAAAPVASAGKPVRATIAVGDKRAKAMKRKAAKVAAIPCANADVLPAPGNLDVVRAALLCLHNQVRARHGLPALKENAKLAKAALGHSAAMVSQGYFEHTSPDGDTFVDRVIGAGYAKRHAAWTLGENLAWGTGELSTPGGLMTAWMNSPDHRANILERAYREVGIGVRAGVPGDASAGATVTADFGVKP